MKARIPLSASQKKRIGDEIVKQVAEIEKSAGVRAQLMLLFCVRECLGLGPKRMKQLLDCQEQLIPKFTALIDFDDIMEEWICSKLRDGNFPEAKELLLKFFDLYEQALTDKITNALQIRQDVLDRHYSQKERGVKNEQNTKI